MMIHVSGLIMILMVCAASAQYGRRIRKSGKSVTARDVVFAMAAAWALGWLWMGVPLLIEWGRYMPWTEIMPAGHFLFGLAVAPLLLVLAAVWLPRLLGVAHVASKKPVDPLSLD